MAADWSLAQERVRVRNRILAGEDADIGLAVEEQALYLAGGGHLAEAIALIDHWRACSTPQQRQLSPEKQHVLGKRAWFTLFSAHGQFPQWADAGWDAAQEEAAHRARLARDRWRDPLRDDPVEQLHGRDLFRLAACLVRPDSAGRMPDEQQERQALPLFERLVRENHSHPVMPEALVLAGEVAARLDTVDTAIAAAQAWARGFRSNPRRSGIRELLCCRHLAPLIIDGALAEPLGITAGEATEHVEVLTSALTSRAKTERQLLYGHWSWQELVARVHELLGTVSPVPGSPQAPLLEGVDEESLAAAEQRLGVQLPSDYREFLSVANGIPPSNVDAGLAPVEQIDWFGPRQSAEMLELLREDEGALPVGAFDQAIDVAQSNEFGAILLLAGDFTSDGQPAWIQHDWELGPTMFPSFRHLVEDWLRGLEERA